MIASKDIDDQRILQSDQLTAFKALTELSDFFQACDFHTGSNLGSECNYRFLQIPFFWASGGNLGLKGPANSCKQVGFAAGVQGNPSAEEQLKQPKNLNSDSNNH